MSTVKNILFDFGGVIVSLNKQQALDRFTDIGFPNIEDYLNEFRQQGIFLEYEEGKIDPENFCKEFRRLAGNENISKEDIDSGWLGFLVGIPDYKYELLKELRKKYKVYLLSNTNPSVMGWATTSDFSPEGLPIMAFFDKCYLSYEIGYTKPDREIFDFIIEDSGMIPSETLFFDDGKANIEMAEKLGFQTYLTDQDEDLRKVFVDRGLLD
ncbi:putative hydrolase of the HAD superfamily [Dysgonomonas hofstadii]|uniref:Putative hydrolase of the HAD superfamily n=1 Tax=Dysgonomonas hofstadii TaxID=637886 RepID=A0A840D080_9BACT|nr:HAD family phosphatase [Dysgonomonas hofstadii]MBB4038335.1 putative hydrolase of the HAD superfamily [Dysgonomonas hofstadii]